MIYKFQPFSVTKELGKEYNAHCALVPDDEDWILILDYDAMVLDPRAYAIMEKAIAKYPGTEVFGCFTNRVGYAHQRIKQSLPMDDRDSMCEMLIEARDRADRYQDGECVSANLAAGFFMLFQKKYWQKVKFQEKIWEPGGRLFDWNFCYPAYERRAVKLILGIQVWHTYRLLQNDYRDASHLK